MEKNRLLKQYYSCMIKSAEIAEQMSSVLDYIRLGSLSMDNESLTEYNQKATKLSEALQAFHMQRQDIALKFGCGEQHFSNQMLEKLAGKNKETIRQATEDLRAKLQLCRDKLELQSTLMQQQQSILNEALESVRVEVNA